MNIQQMGGNRRERNRAAHSLLEKSPKLGYLHDKLKHLPNQTRTRNIAKSPYREQSPFLRTGLAT